MNSKPKKILTLCLIHQHPRILLGMKKRGFGAGLWNGFGGKAIPGETLEEAAVRELQEECGIEASPEDLEKAGILDFDFCNEPKPLQVHIFRVLSHIGEPIETEEMRPQWFYIDEIPFKDMWPEDAYWMPLFFNGTKFRGRVLLDRPSTPEHRSKILEKDIEMVPELE